MIISQELPEKDVDCMGTFNNSHSPTSSLAWSSADDKGENTNYSAYENWSHTAPSFSTSHATRRKTTGSASFGSHHYFHHNHTSVLSPPLAQASCIPQLSLRMRSLGGMTSSELPTDNQLESHSSIADSQDDELDCNDSQHSHEPPVMSNYAQDNHNPVSSPHNTPPPPPMQSSDSPITPVDTDIGNVQTISFTNSCTDPIPDPPSPVDVLDHTLVPDKRESDQSVNAENFNPSQVPRTTTTLPPSPSPGPIIFHPINSTNSHTVNQQSPSPPPNPTLQSPLNPDPIHTQITLHSFPPANHLSSLNTHPFSSFPWSQYACYSSINPNNDINPLVESFPHQEVQPTTCQISSLSDSRLNSDNLSESSPPRDLDPPLPTNSTCTPHAPIVKSKVPFRVGLSKRARITPLLRSVNNGTAKS